MRKPRDFDSELKALADKAKQLKKRRVRHLGELVVAVGADTLDADIRAGALLHAVTSKDQSAREGWRKAGAAFFQGRARKPVDRSGRDPGALFRSKAARHRLEMAKARTDMRDWAV